MHTPPYRRGFIDRLVRRGRSQEDVRRRLPGAQPWSTSTTASLAAVAVSMCVAQRGIGAPCDFAANLLQNGLAETGSMAGWTTSGAETIEAIVTGPLGVPPDQTLGEWCFTGGTGPATQSMTQTIDLSPWGAAIDAGEASAGFCILLQSRAVPGGVDQVTGTLEYRDGVGETLDSLAFADPHVVVNVFEWDLVSDERVLPAGARSAVLTLTYTRTVGLSTDAYADNATLWLLLPCPADLDGSGVVDGADLGLLLGSWGDPGPVPADLDGSGTVDGADLGLLLGAWGPC